MCIRDSYFASRDIAKRTERPIRIPIDPPAGHRIIDRILVRSTCHIAEPQRTARITRRSHQPVKHLYKLCPRNILVRMEVACYINNTRICKGIDFTCAPHVVGYIDKYIPCVGNVLNIGQSVQHDDSLCPCHIGFRPKGAVGIAVEERDPA